MRNTLIFIAIIIAIIALFWSFTSKGTPEPQEVTISDVVTMSQQGRIKSIEIDGDNLLVTENDAIGYCCQSESWCPMPISMI